MPEPEVDRELDRAGRRLGKPARRLMLLAVLIAIPGVLLILAGSARVEAVGVMLLALSGAPALVAVSLLLANLVAWWAARHKPFA